MALDWLIFFSWLCRYLKEAIHCLNNSEAVLCGQDSTNGTPVQRTSHSNQSSGEFPKIYQPDADRDIWRADFGNNTHGSRSTSGTAGNVQSEAPLFDITDKTATLHDLIEEASKEYQKLCPHSVAGMCLLLLVFVVSWFSVSYLVLIFCLLVSVCFYLFVSVFCLLVTFFCLFVIVFCVFVILSSICLLLSSVWLSMFYFCLSVSSVCLSMFFCLFVVVFCVFAIVFYLFVIVFCLLVNVFLCLFVSVFCLWFSLSCYLIAPFVCLLVSYCACWSLLLCFFTPDGVLTGRVVIVMHVFWPRRLEGRGGPLVGAMLRSLF